MSTNSVVMPTEFGVNAPAILTLPPEAAYRVALKARPSSVKPASGKDRFRPPRFVRGRRHKEALRPKAALRMPMLLSVILLTLVL